jgi:hypothetical protein
MNEIIINHTPIRGYALQTGGKTYAGEMNSWKSLQSLFATEYFKDFGNVNSSTLEVEAVDVAGSSFTAPVNIYNLMQATL